LERIILCLEKPDLQGLDLSDLFSTKSSVQIKYTNIPNQLTKEEKNKVWGLFTKIAFTISDNLIKQFPNLIVIGTPTTGSDHINITSKNDKVKLVTLSRFPKVVNKFSSTVEVTWWHILELSRHCSKFHNQVEKAIWNRYEYSSNSFNGKTLGVVGLGRLGIKVAKIANAFGLKVIFSEIREDRINEGESKGFKFVSLETLFEDANIISLHVDDRRNNLNLINSKILQKIHSNYPILVNTSRGFVIEEESVVRALENGKLQGYGTDVLINEQNFIDSSILKNNIIWHAKYQKKLPITITPHIGGATTDSMNLASFLTLQAMRDIIENEPNN